MQLPYSQDKVMDRITLLLDKTPDHISGKIVGTHVILNIVGEEMHYWSPQLNFRVEEDEFKPEETIIAGLIGPKPAVWTLFMLIYFAVGGAGLAISTFGFSKFLLGEYSPFLLAFPIAILFMLTAYKAVKYGESLGRDQIELLKQFVKEATSFEDEI